LHKNAFGGRALPVPTGELTVLPRPLGVEAGKEGKEGRREKERGGKEGRGNGKE